MSEPEDNPVYIRVPLNDSHREWLEQAYPLHRATTHQIRAAVEEGLLFRRYLRGEKHPADIIDSLATDDILDSLPAADDVLTVTDIADSVAIQPLDTDTEKQNVKEHRVKLSASFSEEICDEYSVHTSSAHMLAAAINDAILWRELARRQASAPTIEHNSN